jgi:DNA processing protein
VERVWNDDERAALVALLRTRPSKLSWSDIAAEVSARGSARAFWDEVHPADLFDDADDSALVDAARDIVDWRSAGHGFLTFRDDDYPTQLREIHEMPPVLFHSGSCWQTRSAYRSSVPGRHRLGDSRSHELWPPVSWTAGPR